MGQYYILVNVDKREYCDAWQLGGVGKLGEWCTLPQSLVFPYLMALCNGHGGGDVDTDQELKYLGRWAGDRVVLVGSYWGDGDESLPYAHLYQHVRGSDIEVLQNSVKSTKEEIKSLRKRGGMCYLNTPEEREKMAQEREKQLPELVKALKELKAKPRSERYVNISEDVKREFESLYGTNALDWQKSPYIHGVGMPDFVIGLREKSDHKLTP